MNVSAASPIWAFVFLQLGKVNNLPRPCSNVPLLKSLLQKAIRRKNRRVAAWAASELLHLDPNALLRRLPVIMLEDSMLHSSLPAMVWMMAASSKGWTPGPGQALWLVNAAAALCGIDSLDAPGGSSNVLSDRDIARLWRGKEPQCSLLLSLKARLAFGGMTCDLDMWATPHLPGDCAGLLVLRWLWAGRKRHLIRSVLYFSIPFLCSHIRIFLRSPERK